MHRQCPPFSVRRRYRTACLVAAAVFGLFEGPRASAQLSERFAAFVSPPLRALREELHQNEGELTALPLPPGNESTARIGWHSSFGPPSGVATRFLQIDLGAVEPFDAVVLVPVSLSEAGQERPGYGFPVRFRVESSETPDFAQPVVLADYTESDFTNPGQLPVVVEASGGRGRLIRVTATRLYSRGDRSLFALGELMVLRGNANLAASKPALVSDSANNPPAWAPTNLTDGHSVLGCSVTATASPGNGYHSAIEANENAVKWVQLDLGEERDIEEVRLLAAAPVDFPARLGFGFPRRFRVELGNREDMSDARVLARLEDEDVVNPGANPIGFAAGNQKARYVRVTASLLWPRNNDFIFALSELQVFLGGENIAMGAAVKALDRVETARWNTKFLNDGYNSQGWLTDTGPWLRGLARRRELQDRIGSLHTAIQARQNGVLKDTLLVTGVLLLTGTVGLVLWGTRQRLVRQREVHALRQRLAADLHDEIGSNLGSISLLSRLAADHLPPASETKADLGEIHRIAQDSADAMRDIVWLLQPGPRTAAGLVLRLRETAGQLLKGTTVDFEAKDVPGPFSLELERQIIFVFKEALNNIRKHAQASKVRISVQQTGRSLKIRLEDNGRGFDPGKTSSGLGLEGMQKRVESLGGTLQITSQPGAGTTLELTLNLS